MIFQILIVDDEPHVVDTIRGILEQEPVVDLEIHTAFRGQQALKLCQQYPISLLITDIRMPDMSGLELARQVRQLTPDCNVILLTAYSDFTYAYEGIQLHASDYILKTEDKQIIRSRIFKILGTMEQELRHRSWLESARESNPISDRLCKKLLMPQRSSQQEEAFTLLGFRETGFPLLLMTAKTPSNIPIQADILQKSLMRCLPGRITHLCASTISENVCSLVLSLDPKGYAITGTWLMVTMAGSAFRQIPDCGPIPGGGAFRRLRQGDLRCEKGKSPGDHPFRQAVCEGALESGSVPFPDLRRDRLQSHLPFPPF